MSWFQSSWMIAVPGLWALGPLLVPGPWDTWFRVEPINGVFLGFLGLLGTSVHRFARRNLAGDPSRNRFLFHLVATLWAVEGLVASANFGLFLVFWVLSSLGLHRLLGHYHHRPGARIVVWEKFVISRLGDVALVSAGVLLWARYHTLDFQALGALVHGNSPPWGVGFLLVVGALTKSAQVPFHSWLPRTLEAPTPVSAVLHAGIINAGGLLLVRCWFLVGGHEMALTVLVAVAGVSAIWGGLVLVVQPDVKRRLAWSTVGQMGFMLLEIGLGAPALALVHLMGHGLYKAREFLWSGEPPKAEVQGRVPSVGNLIALSGAWMAGGLAVFGIAAVVVPGHSLVVACAWAALLPLVVHPSASMADLGRRWGLGLLFLAGSTVIGVVAAQLLGLDEVLPTGLRAVVAWVVVGALATAGLVVAFAPVLGGFRWYQKAYASALHGFGFGRWPEAVAGRLVVKSRSPGGSQ